MTVLSASTAVNVVLFLVAGAGAVVLVIAVWAYFYSRALGPLPGGASEDARPALLRRIRWVSFICAAVQMAIFFGIVGAGSFIRDANLFWPAFVLYLGTMLVVGHVQFSIERKIRDVKVSNAEALKQAARGLLAAFALYGLYYGIYLGGLNGLSSALQALGISENWQERITWVAIPVAVFISLVALFLASPVLVRMMMPSKPVTDPAVIAILERSFEKAGLPKPSFWTIEMDRYKAHNAMVTGLRWGRGPFRQALMFSRGLLERLTLDEFEAIMFHEVSHLSLHHIPKRLVFSVVAVILSMGPVFGASILGLIYLPKEYVVITALGTYLLSMAFQIFIVRRQFRIQEMEADANAVVVLGAKLEAFSSGMRKLMAMNDQHEHKKDPGSYFNAGAAHPTVELRIASVEERMRRQERGQPLFTRWEIVSDLFAGRARYATAAFSTVLVTSLMAGAYVSVPRYQLRVAAERGDVAAVQGYISRGYDVNARDVFSYGMTPLMSAAEEGHLDAVRVLLEAGANPNHQHTFGFTPLWCAVENGKLEVVKLLVAHGAKLRGNFPGGTPLTLLASAKGHLSVLEYLADNGLNISARDNKQSTPLTRAAFQGHEKVVRFLVEKGADITERDRRGDSALLLAAREGHLAIAKYLVDRGADINQVDKHGSTPLLMASYFGRTEVAKYLIEKGAHLDELDGDGDSALAMAKKNRSRELEEMLLVAGAKIQVRQPVRAIASEGKE